ncbi:hypothetical protein AKO1_013234 [Acrasis kona]|uniref:Uncharacterized protein n=1 Tax=Acrasis kona TaxID=1008807 RepID=A0AAW2YY76_9EUKA
MSDVMMYFGGAVGGSSDRPQLSIVNDTSNQLVLSLLSSFDSLIFSRFTLVTKNKVYIQSAVGYCDFTVLSTSSSISPVEMWLISQTNTYMFSSLSYQTSEISFLNLELKQDRYRALSSINCPIDLLSRYSLTVFASRNDSGWFVYSTLYKEVDKHCSIVMPLTSEFDDVAFFGTPSQFVISQSNYVFGSSRTIMDSLVSKTANILLYDAGVTQITKSLESPSPNVSVANGYYSFSEAVIFVLVLSVALFILVSATIVIMIVVVMKLKKSRVLPFTEQPSNEMHMVMD